MLLSLFACFTSTYDVANETAVHRKGPRIDVLDRAACEALESPEGWRRARKERDLLVHTLGLGAMYRKDDEPPTLEAPCGPQGESTTAELATQGVDHVALTVLAEAGGGQSFMRRSAGGVTEVFAVTTADRFRCFEVNFRLPDARLWKDSGFSLGVGSGGARVEVDVKR